MNVYRCVPLIGDQPSSVLVSLARLTPKMVEKIITEECCIGSDPSKAVTTYHSALNQKLSLKIYFLGKKKSPNLIKVIYINPKFETTQSK